MNDGFSIVAALDANENMKTGKIARSFTALELIDLITKVISAASPGMCIRGSNQIDRMQTSADLSVLACSFYTFNFSTGDQRIIVVDLEKKNLFSLTYSNSHPTKMRRLMSSNPSTIDSHLTHTKEKVTKNKILPKLNKLVNDKELSIGDSSDTLNKLDDQLHHIFIKTEKQCSKTRSGQVNFSPELSKLELTW